MGGAPPEGNGGTGASQDQDPRVREDEARGGVEAEDQEEEALVLRHG
jgi:hypothetical protein